MAFGLGFAGGYADVIEAPPPVRQAGSGGGLGFRWPRLEPWQPPAPPPPPPPLPVKVKVTIRWPYIAVSVRVTAVTLPPITTYSGEYRTSARVTGPPFVVWLLQTARQAKEAQELAELALVLEVWR